MCLWSYDLGTGNERLIADSGELTGSAAATREEQIRRERTRDQSVGMTDYATDRDVRLAAFALAGRLWLAGLDDATVTELPARGPVADPRLNPDGTLIAYVSSGALRVIGTDGGGDRELIAPEHPEVSYGLPEHVAEESMGRHRGYWWAPAGRRLLVARVDISPVRRWYLADPANPGRRPTEIAYPVVGTANVDVSLWLLDAEHPHRTEVRWDRAGYEYVVAAHWSSRLLVVVQSRNQRSLLVLEIDQGTGVSTVLREDTDPC